MESERVRTLDHKKTRMERDMKIDDLIETANQAITGNFRVRNTRVFACTERQARIERQRRNEVREWVHVVRAARDPAMRERVSYAIAGGALMAHDLRKRVIRAANEFNQQGA